MCLCVHMSVSTYLCMRMSKYVCMYIFVCVYVYLGVHVCLCVHVCMCLYVYVCLGMWMYMPMHVCICRFMSVCMPMWVCTCICAYVFACVCVCTCMCTCVRCKTWSRLVQPVAEDSYELVLAPELISLIVNLSKTWIFVCLLFVAYVVCDCELCRWQHLATVSHKHVYAFVVSTHVWLQSHSSAQPPVTFQAQGVKSAP
jgi:hypothetical protein